MPKNFDPLPTCSCTGDCIKIFFVFSDGHTSLYTRRRRIAKSREEKYAPVASYLGIQVPR